MCPTCNICGAALAFPPLPSPAGEVLKRAQRAVEYRIRPQERTTRDSQSRPVAQGPAFSRTLGEWTQWEVA